MFGIFSSTGQSCIAGSRLFIQRSIYAKFAERLAAATKSLRVGHSFESRTQVAPMIHDDHRAAVEAFVDMARNEGGKFLAGGSRPRGAEYDKGIYLNPTIVAGLSHDSRVCQEEIFGPVVVALPFDEEEDVIAQANANEYGLACGIWTTNMPRALRVGRAIAAGTIWINTYKQFSISTPFGGFKASGVGREKGRAGLLAYMNQKSYYLDLSEAPHPWAT
jgi:acyl-CoA reductase-like NAD-dependent aldehyde dehydrogenase